MDADGSGFRAVARGPTGAAADEAGPAGDDSDKLDPSILSDTNDSDEFDSDEFLTRMSMSELDSARLGQRATRIAG